MTTTVRTSRNDDLFFIGLGAAAGVAVVFAGLAIWQVAAAPALTGLLSGAAAPGTTMLAQEAQAMGLPLVEGTKAFWYVARAGGILAYMLLWLATLWGVFISSKMVKGWIDGTLLYDMHEFLPILAVVFAVLHAAVLLGDAYIGFSVLDLLVPFRAPYRPLWTGFGSLALYLSVALIASFYLRSRIGRRVWRLFHYTTYLAFILALAHGIQAGTDSSQPMVMGMYVATGASLLFATFYRILTVKGSRKPVAAPIATRRRPAATDAEAVL